MFLEQADEDIGASFINGPPACDRKDRAVRSPVGRQLFGIEDGPDGRGSFDPGAFARLRFVTVILFGSQWRHVGIVGQVFDHPAHRVANAALALHIQDATTHVRPRQGKGRHCDVFVESADGMLLQIGFGMLQGFLGVGGEQALVEALGGRQRRLVAQ